MFPNIKRIISEKFSKKFSLFLLALILGISIPIGASFSHGEKPQSEQLNNVALLVGDSVPLHTEPYFVDEAKKYGWTVVNAAMGSCGALTSPLVDGTGKPFSNSDKCIANEETQLQAIELNKPKIIIWMSRFEISDRLAASGDHLDPTMKQFWSANQSDLERKLKLLTSAGAHVILVPIEKSGIGMLTRCSPTDCKWFLKRLISAEGRDFQDKWNAILQTEADKSDAIEYFSIDKFVCNDDALPCDDVHSGKPARLDGTHYTQQGAELFIPQLMKFAVNIKN